MDLMEQVALWNENDEHQRIIDAIEALPEAEQTPDLINALARAYNNLAQPGDAPMFRRAISLLESVRENFEEEHPWNFRMGYAWYYLDQEGPALGYFEKALEARPGDEDTIALIQDCRSRLALPRFEKSFRERTEQGWASFLAGEAELRTMIEERQSGRQVIEACGKLLKPAFEDMCFELGFNGRKPELILTPEGDRTKLFQLEYFKRHAPEAVLERWNVLVGRQPSTGFGLRMFDREISAADVRVWIQEPEGNRAVLSCYSEKLVPVLQENEGRAYWLFSILLDQTIGELAAMETVACYDLLENPEEGDSVTMDHLAEALKDRGYDLPCDAGQVLERYTAYELKPDQGEDADLRLDVFAGATCCLPLLQEYYQSESGLMDHFHQDGVVPGFFYYPLDCFDGVQDRGRQILDFRDSLEAAVLERAGKDAVTFTGGASGIYYGYLDFIAWDLKAVLNAAVEVFGKTDVSWAAFHTFRRDVGGITLKDEAETE